MAVVDVAMNKSATTLPATESLEYGEVVPIPKFPFESKIALVLVDWITLPLVVASEV